MILHVLLAIISRDVDFSQTLRGSTGQVPDHPVRGSLNYLLGGFRVFRVGLLSRSRNCVFWIWWCIVRCCFYSACRGLPVFNDVMLVLESRIEARFPKVSVCLGLEKSLDYISLPVFMWNIGT